MLYIEFCQHYTKASKQSSQSANGLQSFLNRRVSPLLLAILGSIPHTAHHTMRAIDEGIVSLLTLNQESFRFCRLHLKAAAIHPLAVFLLGLKACVHPKGIDLKWLENRETALKPIYGEPFYPISEPVSGPKSRIFLTVTRGITLTISSLAFGILNFAVSIPAASLNRHKWDASLYGASAIAYSAAVPFFAIHALFSQSSRQFLYIQ